MAVDTNSETWRIVVDVAEVAIRMAHRELEGAETTTERTNQLRGRIAVCREIIGLSSPPKPPPVIARDDYGMKVDGY